MDLIASPGVLDDPGSLSDIAITTSMPSITLPKTECALSKWGVGTKVMKN